MRIDDVQRALNSANTVRMPKITRDHYTAVWRNRVLWMLWALLGFWAFGTLDSSATALILQWLEFFGVWGGIGRSDSSSGWMVLSSSRFLSVRFSHWLEVSGVWQWFKRPVSSSLWIISVIGWYLSGKNHPADGGSWRVGRDWASGFLQWLDGFVLWSVLGRLDFSSGWMVLSSSRFLSVRFSHWLEVVARWMVCGWGDSSSRWRFLALRRFLSDWIPPASGDSGPWQRAKKKPAAGAVGFEIEKGRSDHFSLSARRLRAATISSSALAAPVQ